MATEIKVWEIVDKRLKSVDETPLREEHLEKDLEEWIANNPDILGEELLVIDRQRDIRDVGRLDLLCMNQEGRLVIVELKRDRTPREAVAQALDYAAWLDSETEDQIEANATEFLKSSLADAFSERFQSDLPEYHCQDHRVILVAPRLDASAERIINYLSERHGVDINAVFFKYSKLSDGKEILARSILMPDQPPKVGPRKPGPRQEAYRAFFQGLIEELRERHNVTGTRAVQPQSWYVFSSGHAGIQYAVSFSKGSKVRTEVFIDRGETALNKDLFDRLAGERERIQEEYGESLEWERLDHRPASRIAAYTPGSIDADARTLEKIRDWAVKRLLLFKKVFGPRLSALLGSETKGA